MPVLDLDRRGARIGRAWLGRSSAVVRHGGKEAPLRVGRLMRGGMRSDAPVFTLTLDRPVDEGNRYPGLLLLLGTDSERIAKETLDPKCAYLAYLHAVRGWSGTELVALAVALATAAGMERIRVHDNAHVPCGKNELSLSDALLVTRGITFYGRLGFLPMPGGHDLEHEDAAAVVRGLCASHAHAKRATVGALRGYLKSVAAAMRRPKQGLRFWLAFDVGGVAYRLPVAPDNAAGKWNGGDKARAAAVLRFLLRSGATDATPLVDVIDKATRSGACSDLGNVFDLMRAPSTYMAMRFDTGEFNQVTSADKGQAVLAAWPDHAHFHKIMRVRPMGLERPLGSGAGSTRLLTSYCQ